MRAVVLVGHGSLRAGSGAAMIRLAAHARTAGVAPIVEAGFLNYSRPTFAQALARCVAKGATEVIVQPYFLVPGKFVRTDLPRLLTASQAAHPTLALSLAEPFGDHPALAELVHQRAVEAEYTASNRHKLPARTASKIARGVAQLHPADPKSAGLLIMAHGSPDGDANAPIYAVAERLRARQSYGRVVVAFMELNEPSIADAIDALAAHVARVIAVPYFLQLGGHVATDLPETIAAAQTRHPDTAILLAQHLGHDQLLLSVIADRVDQVQQRPTTS